MQPLHREAVQLAEAQHLRALGMELGEGPVWIEDALWFVDIKRKTIFRLNPASSELEDWAAPEHVGWVLPSATKGLIAGLKSGPHRFHPEVRSFEPIGKVDIDLPDNRLNDAATDPTGRVWFGTMDNLEGGETGKVYVLDEGEVRESGIAPVAITNGPAISPCGTWLYHVDTLGKQVIRHEVQDDGTIGQSTPFLDFNGEDTADWGWPDGATCDADGGVWLGFYSGWAARRFDAGGALTDEVRLPVANVTKIALGGADRRTAYATTARQGLSKQELAAQPLAGDLFTFPVAIPGLPVTPANT